MRLCIAAVIAILLLFSSFVSLAQLSSARPADPAFRLYDNPEPAAPPASFAAPQATVTSYYQYLSWVSRSGSGATARSYYQYLPWMLSHSSGTMPAPTPTPTPTPTPLPPPAGPCRELITNGDFESRDGWQMPPTTGGAQYTAAVWHSESYSAQLGQPLTVPPPTVDPGITVTHSMLYQTITIPAAVDWVKLTFWYNPGSANRGSGDYQQFLLLDGTTSHLLVRELQRLHRDDRLWLQTSFDLTDYRGRSLDVAFEVVNDSGTGGGRTWMYVDDVSVQACTAPTAMPTATYTTIPIATSTATPSATSTASSTATGTLTPTATSTLTPAPSDTPTPTATTVTPSPTITVTPLPPGCREYLVNGDFETNGGWTLPQSTSWAQYTTTTVHGGAQSLFLGLLPPPTARPGAGNPLLRLDRSRPAMPQAATDSEAYQTVSLPVDANKITLSFWYNAGSEDLSGADAQAVWLLQPESHTLLSNLVLMRENGRVWQQKSIDLSGIPWSYFALDFQVHNDSTDTAGRTWLYIDDASLVACR